MKWLSGFLSLVLLIPATASADVWDIAHRGYAAVNPESTMLAFQRAHEQGADGLEFDVRQTQDRVLVVTHDSTIPELANSLVESTLFSDLSRATDIPSLDKVLAFAKRSGQTVWLEIKQSHRYPGIIDRVIGLVEQYGLADVTVIQSFNHNDLQTIKQKKPELRLLALYASGFRLNDVPSYVDYLGLPIDQIYLNATMISRLHQMGKQVIFWRRNDLSENKQVLQQFIDAGADGFMLDRSLKAIMR